MPNLKTRKVEKIHLGESYQGYGMEEPDYDISKRLFEYESEHSHLREDELFLVLQEIEDKLNELIDAFNQHLEEHKKEKHEK